MQRPTWPRPSALSPITPPSRRFGWKVIFVLSGIACAWGNAGAAGQDSPGGFWAGSGLRLQNRLLYEHLHYARGDTTRTVSGDTRSDKAEESAYGLMMMFESGYTRGLAGFGVDAHAYGALNVDSHPDRVRSNPRYVARDNGNGLARTFGRAGAAVKVRIASTELKYGEMRTRNPIFSSSDSRLLPETNRGWLLSGRGFDSLSWQAGHFTRWTDRNARQSGGPLLANYSGVNGGSFTFAGGSWATPLDGLGVSAYYGRYRDVWNTVYLGGTYTRKLADRQALALNLNLYRNTDSGQAKAGELDNTTWSLMANYTTGPHRIGLGYQKVQGNTPFDYVNRGSIWLDNAMQLSDFNGPHEASWQIRYDVDLGEHVTPGLTAGMAYTRGSRIDYRHVNSVYRSYLGATGHDGRHWERDVVVRYTVQQGPAKRLALQLRYSVHRANAAQGELNVDQFRLMAEMPISIL